MRLVAAATRSAAQPAHRLLGGESFTIEIGRLFAVLVVAAWSLTFVIGFLAALRLLTAMGFAAAIFGFRRRTIGVLGATLLCTLDPLTRHFLLTGDGLLRWNTFNYWLLTVMVASVAFVWRVGDPHSRIIKMFLGLLAVELVFSPAPEMGVQHLLAAVTMLGLLVYFAHAAADAELWYMVGVVNGLTGAIGGLFFFLWKASLPYINANAWAFFPETAIIAVCLGFRQAQSRPHGQLILGVLATVNYLWVFLSGSRGGMLIATVGLVFLVMGMRRAATRAAFVTTAAAVAIGVMLTGAFGAQQNKSLSRITKMLDSEQSITARTNGRSELAKAGWHMFKEHPLGIGTGGFARTWATLGFVPGISGFSRGVEFQAHSGWVKVLAENGWPGMLLLIAYVFSFAVYGARGKAPGDRSMGLLVTTMLAVAFLSTEFQGKGFWLLAAAATAQLHPAEMSRCLAVEGRRFGIRPRRVLGRAAA